MQCRIVAASFFFFTSAVVLSALLLLLNFATWQRNPIEQSKKTPQVPDFDRHLYTPKFRRQSPHSNQNGQLRDLNEELLSQLSPPYPKPRNDAVAIILPYRNRYAELFNFLLRMHSFLRKRRTRYVMIVAEQSGQGSFNRAKLFNAVVREVRDSAVGDPLHGIDCFILHDVDKVPVSNSTVYDCGPAVRQMATALASDFEFEPLYKDFLGAATAFRWEHLEIINGASNIFYGWGGEDDDMLRRLRLKQLPIDRASDAEGVFFEFNRNHSRERAAGRGQLIELDKVMWRMQHDGIAQITYRLVNRKHYEYFVWMLFDL
ncbi:hypothetical protein AAHC03_020595 [Spirometra sp. Aus1]